MKIDTLIDELSQFHPKGFDLSLGRITRLLDRLGNPHLKIPSAIHVAGTNGKGSTLAFIRAILEAQGYKVHVHTSPHLVNWTERYRLDGKLVSDDVLTEATRRVADANAGEPITIFEIMSAVMFVLFSEHEADFSLVEVGLGGRADATNMIEKPVVSVITPVDLDHQAYLGDTLAKIAFEKGGIIKPDVPVAIGRQHDEAREVLEEIAQQKGSSMVIAGQDFDCYRDATGFVYQDSDGLLDLPIPALVGEHQLENAGLAIAALQLSGIDLTNDAIETGMKTVYWPGRMQPLPAGRIARLLEAQHEIWIDGGHNPAAGIVVADALKTKQPKKTILVCGMINTKDPVGYFEAFTGMDTQVLTVPIETSDAGISPTDLASAAESAGLQSTACTSLEDALSQLNSTLIQKSDPRILFCGSLYFAGDVLKFNETPPQ